MNLALAFDSETTSKDIDWSNRSNLPHQPHMVQLAAKLVDLDTRKAIQSIDLIVKPDGWIIPDEVIEIHGITNELANEVGLPEIEVLRIFMELWVKCNVRICHNTTFDNRIIWIALCRYLPDLVPKEVWKDKDQYYCTFQNFKKLIGGKDGHKLKDAYKYFTGEPLRGAHDAMTDVNACIEVYFGIQDKLGG